MPLPHAPPSPNLPILCGTVTIVDPPPNNMSFLTSPTYLAPRIHRSLRNRSVANSPNILNLLLT